MLASGNRSPHVSRQEGQADLVRRIHPAEAFARNEFEVDTLVAVLGVDHVTEFHGVESARVITVSEMNATWRGTIMTYFSGTTPLKSTKATVIM